MKAVDFQTSKRCLNILVSLKFLPYTEKQMMYNALKLNETHSTCEGSQQGNRITGQT